MTYKPLYRDVDTAGSADGAIRLADFFNSDSTFFDEEDGCQIFPSRDEDVFARGRFRVRTLRPQVQCVDCDLQIVSGMRVRSAYHPFICLAMLLKGTWSSQAEKHPIPVPTVMVPSFFTTSEPIDFTTEQTAGQIGRMVGICIGPGFFDGFEADDNDRSVGAIKRLVAPGFTYRTFVNCDALKLTLKRLYDNPYRGAMAALYAESLVLSAVVELASHTSDHRPALSGSRSDRDRAHDARCIIDRDLGSVPSVPRIAATLGIGETTLRRAFKAAFGTTIFDYLRNRRLEAARVMLREKRLRVSEIAYRVGYADPANFSNAYRLRFGHSPKLEA